MENGCMNKGKTKVLVSFFRPVLDNFYRKTKGQCECDTLP